MSVFNPEQFLDASTTEEFTKLPPLPESNYVSVIGEIEVKSGISEKGNEWVQYIISHSLQVPADVQTQHGLPATYNMKDRVFIDVRSDGHLDTSPGKNQGLRKYRAALGLDKPGEPFSGRMMQGRTCQVLIKHEMYNNEPVAKIWTVAKLA